MALVGSSRKRNRHVSFNGSDGQQQLHHGGCVVETCAVEHCKIDCNKPWSEMEKQGPPVCSRVDPQRTLSRTPDAAREDNAFLSAIIHLLAMASRSPGPSQSSFWRLAIPSLQSVQTFSATFLDFSLRGLLAAMPALLSCCHRATVINSTALLGAMAIDTYVSVQEIAKDELVLSTLLHLLTMQDPDIVMEACQAVGNIVSCQEGRQALRDLKAVEKLMMLLSLSAGSFVSSTVSAATHWLEPCAEFADLVIPDIFDALEVLVFHDLCLSPKSIPIHMRVSALKSMQIIWRNLCIDSDLVWKDKVQERLPKLFMWLSLEQETFENAIELPSNLINSLYGSEKPDFEHFWREHWECSPVMMKMTVYGHHLCGDLFGGALKAGKESTWLKKLLDRSLACPPFCSDELEPMEIFKEVQGKLGMPLVLGQDVRLLKSIFSGHCSTEEDEYHKTVLGLSHAEDTIIKVDSEMCLDAYDKGYTVALRGVEFRCPQVAAIAESLAVCFGQATVGANLYLTPRNSQGFPLHADDHCVLVWQLSGSKYWKIFPPIDYLPRLYTQKGILESGSFASRGWGIIVEEGDMLYIPRGFPHKASTKQEAQLGLEVPFDDKDNLEVRKTIDRKSDCRLQNGSKADGASEAQKQSQLSSAGEKCQNHYELQMVSAKQTYNCMDRIECYKGIFRNSPNHSLHITFGIEVEPPFDWEGFVHMSLHCWAKRQEWEIILRSTEADGESSRFSGGRLQELCLGLLHVAIRSCADQFGQFRKACLIAAKPVHQEKADLSSISGEFKPFFSTLLDIVAETADFQGAMHAVLTAIDAPEKGSLDWMRWLRHLPSGALISSSLWCEPCLAFSNMFLESFLNRKLEQFEVQFLAAKSLFISHASFTETCGLFVDLLQQYRSIRKRFTNGILALQN